MSLLKTQEYIDLVELNRFLTEHYDYPATGSYDSFHRTFCDAIVEFGQDTMHTIEMDPRDSLEWYEENYSPAYAKVVEAFRKLMADGHLPERNEFNVFVWW